MKIIALEEGFLTQSVLKLIADSSSSDAYTMKTSAAFVGTDVIEAYLDLGEGRIAAMDEAGIDMQVLSFSAPQIADTEAAARVMAEANDEAAKAVKQYPSRFAAFAALAATDPKAAVAEFERALTKLGFVGGFICGSINGEFLDDKKYWPILECAEAHHAPIYLHPYYPLPALMQTYFKGREELSAPVWGFMVDASCHFLRLLTAGVFDQFPELKIILGHLGESIPYNLDRINSRLSAFAQDKLQRSPSDYIRDNLVITTSGNFSPQSVLCAIGTIGVDNILFSADWPNESNRTAVDFLRHLPIGKTDLEKIAHENAERVLGLNT
jgi:predicted TIM-barrel fold metal-dependent hydrolase